MKKTGELGGGKENSEKINWKRDEATGKFLLNEQIKRGDKAAA